MANPKANTAASNLKPQTLNFKLFYIISFLEGATVMGAELLAAKMIAPYYGNSLYVWTSVLATTLLGLTVGYYIGGNLSVKYNVNKVLVVVLGVSAALFVLMPFLSTMVMSATISMSLQAGSLISCFVFILPILICFGIVSPLIIRIVSDQLKEVGSKAGTVYTISTAGGIIMTFLIGFYMIPFLGIKMSAYICAAIMGLALIINLMAIKQSQQSTIDN
jgi:MFS family permease